MRVFRLLRKCMRSLKGPMTDAPGNDLCDVMWCGTSERMADTERSTLYLSSCGYQTVSSSTIYLGTQLALDRERVLSMRNQCTVVSHLRTSFFLDQPETCNLHLKKSKCETNYYCTTPTLE